MAAKGPPSRVTRSKETSRATYDRLSLWYDLLAWGEWRVASDGLERLAAASGERILEIGFGTGRSLVVLARAVGCAGHIFGIDISEGMRRVASRRLCRAGLADCVTLTCGDAIHLPYESDSFDGVFVAFTLELFDNSEIPIVLRECQRVLRAQGRMVVVALQKRTPPPVPQRLYEAAHRRFPRIVDCRPIEVGQSLSDAGFAVTEFQEHAILGLPVQVALGTLESPLMAAPEDDS